MRRLLGTVEGVDMAEMERRVTLGGEIGYDCEPIVHSNAYRKAYVC